MSETPQHSVESAEQTVSIDREYNPVQAEIIRRRLYNIAQEMGTVMIRTSGNPVISEAVDFSTFIASPEGEIIAYSGYMTMHAGPAREAVQHIRETIPDEDINPGDQFICNDPFTTGVNHPPDVGIVKPIFYDEELIAWCWAEAHLLDVGGVSPGGFAPQAQEAYAEALRWPGVKIVENEEIVEDIKRLIMTNVRLPVRVFNDIRALIAANNRCNERLMNTVDEFGLETFNHYQNVNDDLTEAAFRQRIETLPDGTYTTTEIIEHDGHQNNLYEISAEMTVKDDSMTFDYSGSSEQAPGFINASRGASVGSTMSPLMLQLAPDIPINEGMFHPVEIITPEGTITNPTVPAPVSSGHMETGLAILKSVTFVLTRAMSQSEDVFTQEHAMAPFHETWPVAAYSGMNQYGEPDVFLDMNGGGSGGGAQTVHDGIDAASSINQLNNGLPDIEINEDEHPMLYLWRRINIDSGGPGEYRGGQGIDYAWTLHEVGGGQETVASATTQVPTQGVIGGYPASTTVFELIQKSDIDSIFDAGDIPASLKEIDGAYEQLPAKHPEITLTSDTVFANKEGGGGGLGDPLQRDPEAVVSDLASEFISRKMAENTYGVVLNNGSADKQATRDRRKELQKKRRSWDVETKYDEAPQDVAYERPFHQYINVVKYDNDTYLQCTECESVFAPLESPDEEEWLSYTATNESPIEERFEELSIFVQERVEDPDVRLREHACPDCGVMFQVTVNIV